MFEVENHPDPQPGNSEVVQDLPDFMIPDAIDGFGIDHDRLEGNQVRNELTDSSSFIIERVAGLLDERDSPEFELANQGVLIRFFQKSMTHHPMDFHGRIQNPADFPME
jgi:hypothetical protein